jgi:hypothetical protein
MGTPMTLPAVRAPSRATPVVTPLLAFLAGSHAEAIAHLWPAPHEGFLALPAARRHAAAILAARCAPHVQWMAARSRDGELAAEIFGQSPPGGLMKALGRMGEILWASEDYDRFLDLFGEAAACGLIRHMKALQGNVLRIIEVLPPQLRQASIVTHLGTDEQAVADLVSAWGIALRVRGLAAAPDLAQRFGRAAGTAALFDMAREVVQPLDFTPAGAPPELPAPFERVHRLDTLSSTALEFRNCLRDFVADLAAGRMAVFVWRGAGGPAAVALRHDPAGWRLAEARGRDNAEIGDEALMAIVAAVREAGVRTGESWGWLHRRLEDRADDTPARVSPPEPASWRVQLGLGNLWD